MAENAIQVFAFTMQKNEWGKDELMEKKPMLEHFLRDMCKSWIFQLEKGEGSGLYHFQGMFRMLKKITFGNLVIKFKEWATENGYENFGGIHVSRAHDCNALDNYCQKADTRVDGPWTDKDEARAKRRARYVDLSTWQNQMVERLTTTEPDDRTIIYVYDKLGGCGKTLFANCMRDNHEWCVLTPGKADNMAHMAAKQRNAPGFIVNIPRTIARSHDLDEIYEFLENLKDGHINDSKYDSEAITINPPHVVILSNHQLKGDKLSADRVCLIELTARDKAEIERIKQAMEPSPWKSFRIDYDGIDES